MKNKGADSRLVIKFQDHLKFPYHRDSQLGDFFSQNQVFNWKRLLKNFPDIDIKNLFPSVKPGKIKAWVNKAMRSDPDYKATNLLSFFAIDCPAGIQATELLGMLSKDKAVELAYRETIHYSPSAGYLSSARISRGQEYLYPAPQGIDIKYAWGFPGGDGSGNVRFIDIEKGWILNHEAIDVSTFPKTGINRLSYADHGAGVLGIIMMQQNEAGAIGATPKAKGYVISQFRPDGSLNTADAIMAAIDHLNFGDILLLEAQVSDSTGSKNLWPIEIQDAIYNVIRLATALGIIVIEAAGNGDIYSSIGNDLDQFRFNGKKLLDPGSKDFRDSGAIIVAASSRGTPHKRVCFSNYGKRINCFSCGESVLTAGNHPGLSGYAINTYTENFGGTSSAAAIIAGAAISVQSIKEANHHNRLSPVQMRQLLSNQPNGTQSANGSKIDKIGVMPDLRKIIEQGIGIARVSKNIHA